MSFVRALIPKYIHGSTVVFQPYLLWEFPVWQIVLGLNLTELWIGVRWCKEQTRVEGYKTYVNVVIGLFPGLFIQIGWLTRDQDPVTSP